jgi:glycosyltransferase involved in cell wall biosynthesis
MKILHVITDLSTGGAEMMLVKLLSEMDPDRFTHSVLSLRDQGRLAARVAELGFPVTELDLKGPGCRAGAILGHLRRARHFGPDLVQGWMYHGNLAALVLCRLLRLNAPILWNIRQSLYDIGLEKRATQAVIRLGALCSSKPRAILYNSRLGAGQHRAFGFHGARVRVIPNGFDCNRFRPDFDARRSIRAELGIPEDSIVVGVVARYHPVKGHDTFFQAAKQIARDHKGVRFLLAGAGVVWENPVFAGSVAEAEPAGRFHFLGERSDICRLTAALDIAVSPSHAEGFSNTIGEAMACGVPCVVTDVGDSRFVAGETGVAVPPGDPAALAAGVGTLIRAGTEGRRALGRAARARIQEHFSISRVARMVEDLYEEILHRCGESL